MSAGRCRACQASMFIDHIDRLIAAGVPDPEGTSPQ